MPMKVTGRHPLFFLLLVFLQSRVADLGREGLQPHELNTRRTREEGMKSHKVRDSLDALPNLDARDGGF